MKRRNIKVNVLVDLNLPQNVVDKECNTVKEMMTVFTTPNLYVTFMHGNEVSETMAPTDYVLNNYFVSYPDSVKYLYRSILLKKKEMEDRVGVWSGDQKMSLVVFSDERVYSDEDEPSRGTDCETALGDKGGADKTRQGGTYQLSGCSDTYAD